MKNWYLTNCILVVFLIPTFLIRTSGEYRLSNFLLWQSAYTEIYMTETFWPAFREDELLNAIYDFQLRKDGLEELVPR